MITITLLGTGGPIPDPQRAGPATLIAGGSEQYLVDAGRGVLMRLAAAGSGAAQLRAVLLTHLHSDHITDLNDIITTRWITTFEPSPLTIVGPAGTRRVVAGIGESLGPDIGYRIAHHDDLDYPPPVEVVEATEGEVYLGGDVRIACAPTDHRPVEPTVAFRFDYGGSSVVAAGDTVPCAGLDRLCEGAQALVHTVIRKDVVSTIPIPRVLDTLDYHSSPAEAARTAARAGMKTLVMTHYFPLPADGHDDTYRALAAEHFDGAIEVGDDLHRARSDHESHQHLHLHERPYFHQHRHLCERLRRRERLRPHLHLHRKGRPMTESHVPIPTFEGRIGRTRAESEPSFGESPHPGEDAPNVVIVLLDDTGFAQFGCYGSDIDTANVDRLAADGLQFTNFHVTPLCSPTRAALMTGRSQHAVGMRTLANFITGFPNQLGHISNHGATVAEVLGAEGYATLCAGKWHLARTQDGSAAGPFDQWPLGRGFDRFYGFLEGETDQFHPELVIDNHRADPPAGPDEGYHLSEDLVDQLLLMVSDSKGIRPDRPFFAYLPFGATHAPHQSPAGYLAKYRGRYDEGWDVVRERWYRRQLELGVIPDRTRLAPRNPGVEPWDSLPDSHQRFAARLQEAFAAFLDHTDDQIGRLVDGLDRLGQLDNTILMVLSDNGASQEGGAFGVMHEMKWFNGIPEIPEEAIARLDEIGGPRSYVNYPWGWAQCGNTPFKWYKQNTHEGGVHVPLVVHWPDGIAAAERGTMRHQFVNVSDIVPTVYELLGVAPPEVFKGLEQMPVTGHSFAGVLDDAAHPPTNTLQYFEMHGSRALVAGPWKAVCRHVGGDDFETEQWELYDLSADWSECEDLAAQRPDKLAELIDLWWSEAERNGVLPLEDRWVGMFSPPLNDRSPHPVSRRYRYRPPMSPIAVSAAASPGGRKFDLDARVTRGPGDDGVIWATGSASAGVAMFVQNDRLVVDYNAFGDHTILESSMEVPAGDATVSMRLKRTSRTTGTLELGIDGAECGRCDLPVFMGIVSANGASIGRDHGSAVSDRYSGPFPFSGTLHEVEIRRGPRTRVDDINTAHAEMARQ